jgi:hypothetical protein
MKRRARRAKKVSFRLRGAASGDDGLEAEQVDAAGAADDLSGNVAGLFADKGGDHIGVSASWSAPRQSRSAAMASSISTYTSTIVRSPLYAHVAAGYFPMAEAAPMFSTA